jgi:Meiotically Up-regulated Gene 113 (MUG113) protein
LERAEILEVIRRTAQANGGIPLGEDRLVEIGIPPAVWGRYWARLSAAQREAGVEPNKKNEAVPEEDALAHLVRFIREIGAIPTSRERVVKHHQDPRFPSERIWKRLGPNSRLLARLLRYAETHPGHEDVVALSSARTTSEPPVAAKVPAVTFGTVYLLKGPGSRYKIGRTNAFGRRRRELSIQLPFDTRKVHVIETDDPAGVEAYWHQRFATKRINSEWFALDAAEVAAFKRWKRLR